MSKNISDANEECEWKISYSKENTGIRGFHRGRLVIHNREVLKIFGSAEKRWIKNLVKKPKKILRTLKSNEEEESDASNNGDLEVKYEIAVKYMTLAEKRDSNMCRIFFLEHKRRKHLDFKFKNSDGYNSFVSLVKNLTVDLSCKGVVSDNKIPVSDEILVEIVSVSHLDRVGMDVPDPFVSVICGDNEVHSTKVINNNRNPVWTVKTGSLFLLQPQDMMGHDKILFKVMDQNVIGTNELKYVCIDLKLIREGKGDRLEFSLKSPIKGEFLDLEPTTPSNIDRRQAFVALRSRRATSYDVEFMMDLVKNKTPRKESLIKSESENIIDIFKKQKKEVNGKVVHRTQPFPDPQRKEETKWLSDSEIQKEALSPSRAWLDIGSEKYNKIFLEIIGCDNLPNKDKSVDARNKSDCFVSVVYQDVVNFTDVVNDCLSPRWMPWTKRAFILHSMHASSQIYLGVFDYDSLSVDYIGKITVNLSNFKSHTDYLMQYKLRYSFTDDKNVGNISIRLRIECSNERSLLLSTLGMPKEVYVNVSSEKEHTTVLQTIYGPNAQTGFAIRAISSYLTEILSYQIILFYISEALYSVLLWRNHYDITILIPFYNSHPSNDTSFINKYFKSIRFDFPLHSILAFIAGITLVENNGLIVPYFFGSIAWLMLALSEFENDNPSPWYKCKHFIEFVTTLISGRSCLFPTDIKPHEKEKESLEYMSQMEDRKLEVQQEAQIAFEENEKMVKEQSQHEIQIAKLDTDISTTNESFFLAPFKPTLYPIQLMLESICCYLRSIRSILLWKECYYSFWITASSILLFIPSLLIPWNFIMLWISRILVWLILGPWMKLLDIFYFQKMNNLTKEERKEQENKLKMNRDAAFYRILKAQKIKHEDAVKLKDMKTFMFGKYSVQVPTFNDRTSDIPLPTSSAKVLKTDIVTRDNPHVRINRIQGQELYDTMIPLTEDKAAELRKISSTKSLETDTRISSEQEPLLKTTSTRKQYV